MYPLLAIACNLQPKVIRVLPSLRCTASGQDYSRQEGSKEGVVLVKHYGEMKGKGARSVSTLLEGRKQIGALLSLGLSYS